MGIKSDKRLDEFICAHHMSMSTREIAEAVGVGKSTVARHLSDLRKSGQHDSMRDSAVGSSAHSAAVDSDRLAALDELLDRLHAELSTTGGASLARVSSEYRKALEERDALRAALGITQDVRYEFNLRDFMKLVARGYEQPLETGGDPYSDFKRGVLAAIAYLSGKDAIVVAEGVLDSDGVDSEE
ncbi:MAG: ArsR family transcriptional regulator [Eggerthellaceae bacterium]|nr:ArsR family transcriptional regulator [Eggerthellaceae bacterium]